ncbi:MAG TPA: hypothetical protein VLW50_22445 [Streptosporangiaceae bacterium]|nr:hypothetical protein [Streptosporangiaceae bacterium]
MPDDDALPFAERLLALLDATRYSATYKLATLLALIDVAAERVAPDGSAPEMLSGKEIGRRVIELYWPQTCHTELSSAASRRFSPKRRRRTSRRSWPHGGLTTT